MSTQLEIPDWMTQALRLPSADREQQLLIELAVALYAQGVLSCGKVRELAWMDRYAFGRSFPRLQHPPPRMAGGGHGKKLGDDERISKPKIPPAPTQALYERLV